MEIIVKEAPQADVSVISQIEKDAKSLVSEIIKSPDDISLSAQVSEIGKDAVSINTQSISLIEDKVDRNPFDSEGFNKTLSQIKSELDLINPEVVGSKKHPFKTKLLWIIPWTVKRLPKSKEVMSLINEQKDATKDTIEGLQSHLWHEQDKSIRNSVELSKINDNLKESEQGLKLAIYQGSLVWQGLSDAVENETDDVRRSALQRVLNDVATAVVDLQTVQTLNDQTRMGAESLIHNTTGINRIVGRINNILLPSVANMLAVKAAANQQRDIVSMSNAIMESASETIKNTAKEVRQTVVETAQMNSGSMVSLDAIQESCNEFDQMVLELTDIFEKTEKEQRSISSRLSDINNRRSSGSSIEQSKSGITAYLEDKGEN